MYDYQTERPHIFSDTGMEECLKIRENITRLCRQSGACTIEKAIACVTGSNWRHLAIVDYLAEKGHIRIITDEFMRTQDNIIVLEP